GSQANDKLLEGERLGEVVVGSEGKSLDLVLEPGRRGQHEHPDRRVVPGRDPRHLVSRYSRKIPVEDDDVVVMSRQLIQGRVSVERDIGGDGFVPKTGLDRFREKLLILNDQYTHVAAP